MGFQEIQFVFGMNMKESYINESMFIKKLGFRVTSFY